MARTRKPPPEAAPVTSGDLVRLVTRATQCAEVDPTQKPIAAVLAVLAGVLLLEDPHRRFQILERMGQSSVTHIGPYLLAAGATPPAPAEAATDG